ncbi:MAG: segregation/condensation protein A [Defluviitaleaceae bacterium]|nr:segregation/condensation protein A [Defluviitaleaceae bacterium]
MHIKLDAFEGPFDLLFRLIEKNEIDIYDIPMAKLTQQYLEIIKGLPPDMEGMSEFLVMAATLLEIKSRMLLPRFKNNPEEDEQDPREALVQQLIAYKRCQDLAETLKGLENSGQRLFREPEFPLMSKNKILIEPEKWLEEVTTDKLWQTFTDVMQRQALKVDTVRSAFGTVPRERHSISDKIQLITACLKEQKMVRMSELFVDCKTREECVVTFLALLEMIRRRQADLRQDDVFGEIEVFPCRAYN